ncbi:hypothetical protein BJV82DRAFT_629782 [Fennellomyces sp. T-0311]|nr:hypothetical protein BJV82DRAFT_629782 [Fennellomyces sp. T-0311]
MTTNNFRLAERFCIEASDEGVPQTITDALFSRNYKIAIDEASAAINHLFEKQYLALLDKRSYAHAMQCNFKAAMKDAHEMIRHTPTHGRGYLRAAKLYAIQGKQLTAQRICQRGIQAVPKSDPFLQQLRDQKVLAEYHSNQKVDFIARLPLETAFSVFMLLDRGEKGEALIVSKTWQERLLMCGSAWQKLTSTGCTADTLIANTLDKIGPHVHTLLLACNTNSLRHNYLNHMKEGTFENLETLILTKYMTTVCYREQMAIALWQVRHTLTKLVVDFSGNQTTTTFSCVLFACPQLIDLSYTTSESLQLHIGDISSLKKIRPIKQLHIKSRHTRCEDVRTILQRCPELRYLALEGCAHASLQSVFELCPNLEVVGYHSGSSSNTPLSAEELTRPSTGLRILHISAAVDLYHIIPIIHKYGHALENLMLNLSRPAPGAAMINSEEQRPILNNLRHFACRFEPHTQSTVIDNIILVSPGIRTVSCQGIENISTMTDALYSLTRLEQMSLGGGHRGATDTLALRTFFKKHAMLGPHSPLRMIRFQGCDALRDEVFETILATQTLEVIRLDHCHKVTPEGLRLFVSMLDNLESLTLSEMECVNDFVVERIAPSLREVRLFRLANVTDKGIIKLLESSHALEKFCVVNCPLVTQRVTQYAHPKIKIGITS